MKGFHTPRKYLIVVVFTLIAFYLLLWSPLFTQTASRVRITIADSVPPLSSVRGAFSAAYPSKSYYGAYGETAFDPAKSNGGGGGGAGGGGGGGGGRPGSDCSGAQGQGQPR
jgi:hypothetical protein